MIIQFLRVCPQPLYQSQQFVTLWEGVAQAGGIAGNAYEIEIAGALFVAGILFFSGSLVFKIFAGDLAWPLITPAGGFAFIGGWLALALMGIAKTKI